MAKVSVKGQITFPAKWMKFMGGLNVGEWIFFQIHYSDQIVYITKNHDHSNTCAQLLSQNFLTIPNEVRKWFKIQPGDDLEFGYDAIRESIYFKKRQHLLTCPACGDSGSIGDLPCFVCQETGTVEKEHWVNEMSRLIIKSRLYSVNLSIISSKVDSETSNLPIHKVKLESSIYPEFVIESMQDYYQCRIIQDAIEDGSLDYYAEEKGILALLQTSQQKALLQNWVKNKEIE